MTLLSRVFFLALPSIFHHHRLHPDCKEAHRSLTFFYRELILPHLKSRNILCRSEYEILAELHLWKEQLLNLKRLNIHFIKNNSRV